MKKINSIILSIMLAASTVAFGMEHQIEQQNEQFSVKQFNFAGLPPEVQLKILTDANSDDSLQDHCEQIGTYRRVCQYFDTLLSNENVGFRYRNSGLEHSPGMKLFLLAQACKYNNINLVQMATQFGCPDFASILAMTNPIFPDHLNPECAQLICQAQMNEPSIEEQIIMHAITGDEKTLFELLRKGSHNSLGIRLNSGTFRQLDVLTLAIAMSSRRGHADLARKLFVYVQDQNRGIYLDVCLLSTIAGGDRKLFQEIVNTYKQQDQFSGMIVMKCILVAALHKQPESLLDILENVEADALKAIAGEFVIFAAVGGCEICIDTAINFLEKQDFAVNEMSVIMANVICATANNDITNLHEFLNDLSTSCPAQSPNLMNDCLSNSLATAICSHPSGIIAIELLETLLEWIKTQDTSVHQTVALIEKVITKAMADGNEKLVKYLVKYLQENDYNYPRSNYNYPRISTVRATISFGHIELFTWLTENTPVYLDFLVDFITVTVENDHPKITTLLLDCANERGESIESILAKLGVLLFGEQYTLYEHKQVKHKSAIKFVINYAQENMIAIKWEQVIRYLGQRGYLTVPEDDGTFDFARLARELLATQGVELS